MCVCVYLVQHGSGVCCRQTEASSGLRDRRGWKADYHYTDFPLQHFSSESPDRRQKQTETTISFYSLQRQKVQPKVVVLQVCEKDFLWLNETQRRHQIIFIEITVKISQNVQFPSINLKHVALGLFLLFISVQLTRGHNPASIAHRIQNCATTYLAFLTYLSHL